MKSSCRSFKLAVTGLACLLVAAVLSLNCFGQTEAGQISGTVKDASGALVTGARVVAKSVNTGFTREAVTNSSGLYTIPSLKPDTYEVIIEATGFQKFGRRDCGSQHGKSDDFADHHYERSQSPAHRCES